MGRPIDAAPTALVEVSHDRFTVSDLGHIETIGGRDLGQNIERADVRTLLEQRIPEPQTHVLAELSVTAVRRRNQRQGGSDVDGNRAASNPTKKSAATCSRSATISSPTKSPASGSPFTSSNGHARTCSTGTVRPAAARHSTNRRSPTCVKGQTMSAKTSIMRSP